MINWLNCKSSLILSSIALGVIVLTTGCDSDPAETATHSSEATNNSDANSESGSDANSESGSDASSTQPSAGNCETYCTEMAQTCHKEAFHKSGACTAWCQDSLVQLPLGTTSDTDINTIGCRQYWVNQAKNAQGNDKETYCANAAASGGNQCGSWCDNYCDIGTKICTSNNPDYPLSPTRPHLFDDDNALTAQEECQVACNFSTEVLDGVSQTDQHFGYGDTVQCRLHHFQAAMLEGPNQNSAYGLHCGHGAPIPTELCTDQTSPNMINYCEFAIGFCPELFEEGTTTQECRTLMGSLIDDGTYKEGPFLSFTDTNRNSVGCLNYWVTIAAHNPTAYCPKADWNKDHWVPNGEAMCKRP